MSKNIKISNIYDQSLINGEMNENGIKINDKHHNFVHHSYDNAFDCIRADVLVSQTNDLQDKTIPYSSNEDLKRDGYPLKVTYCKEGKIYDVEPLKILPEYPNVYEERNIDNVFPFNKISIVTKKEITNNSDKSDGMFLPRGYNKANIEFLRNGMYYPSGTDTSKQSFLYRELKNDLTDVPHDYVYRNYVKIPRFYLRILFFHSRESSIGYGDNTYYRRYEIISPETYNELESELKEGFFVPTAFNDNDYLYISNVPEIVKEDQDGFYRFISSPFGSEIGCQLEATYYQPFDIAEDTSISDDKLMTSDVWFGIVNILFKIYTGYFYPKFLLGEQTSAEINSYDGVHSLITIYEQKLTNTENVIKYDSETEKYYFSFNLENDVFVCDGKSDRVPSNILAVTSGNSSSLNSIVQNNKSFSLNRGGISISDEVNHWVVRLKLDGISTPLSKKLFITNLLLWKGGSTSENDLNYLVWFDRGFLIRDDLINSGSDRSIYTYFNCKYYDQSIDHNEVTSYQNKAYIVKDTNGDYFNQNDIFIEFELYGDFLVDQGTEVLQYTLFKEGYTDLKQDVVKDYLLGKNVVLNLCSEYDESTYSSFRLIDAQITNFNSDNTEIELRRFNIIDNKDHKGIVINENSIKDVLARYTTFTSQGRKIYVYRHPVNPVAGNIYQNKRSFVDLRIKNQRLNNKFSLLYFNNFISQYEYVPDFKHESYPFQITETYYNMPFLENYSEGYDHLMYPQEGVALFDTEASVVRETYRYNGYTDLRLKNVFIKIKNEQFTIFSGNTLNKDVVCLSNNDYFARNVYSDKISNLSPSSYVDGKIDGVFYYKKDYYYLNFPYSSLGESYSYDAMINVSGISTYLNSYPSSYTDFTTPYILSAGSLINSKYSSFFEFSLNTLNAVSTSTKFYNSDAFYSSKSNRRSNYLTLLYHSGN